MNEEILRFASIHVRSCPLSQDDNGRWRVMGAGVRQNHAMHKFQIRRFIIPPPPVILSEMRSEATNEAEGSHCAGDFP